MSFSGDMAFFREIVFLEISITIYFTICSRSD